MLLCHEHLETLLHDSMAAEMVICAHMSYKSLSFFSFLETLPGHECLARALIRVSLRTVHCLAQGANHCVTLKPAPICFVKVHAYTNRLCVCVIKQSSL